MGIAFKNLGNFEKALDLYKLQLSLAREISERQVEGDALSNIGNVLLSTGRLSEAILYHQSAIDIYRELENRRYEAISTFNLAVAYAENGDYAQAISLSQTALVICEQLSDPNTGMIRNQITEWERTSSTTKGDS
jgi:tetratricopeptide (TPR) repeat protein